MEITRPTRPQLLKSAILFCFLSASAVVFAMEISFRLLNDSCMLALIVAPLVLIAVLATAGTGAVLAVVLLRGSPYLGPAWHSAIAATLATLVYAALVFRYRPFLDIIPLEGLLL